MLRITIPVFYLLSCLYVHATELRRFTTHSRLGLGTEENLTASLRVGDLNGDGMADVAVANGRHWPQQNFVFYNQGRARFNLTRRLGLDLATTYATELGDLDNDGDLDIAVGNDTAPNEIFLNDGQGTFEYHGSFGIPSSIRSLTLADVNLDGHLDILANARGRPNLIYFNDGSAHFRQPQTFGNQSDSTIDVAVGDLNED